MGLIKKQYGKAVLVDEVNKLLQDNLGKYLVEEKLDYLGQPLAKENEDFNWDSENFDFEFELGLKPEFEVALNTKEATTHYNIVIDDKAIDEQVERLQLQFGELVEQEVVAEESEVAAVFTNEDADIANTATIEIKNIKNADAKSLFVGAKVDDQITVSTKDLFNENFQLASALGKETAEVEELDLEVSVLVESINKREPAELNQELFDKLFGPEKVTSLDEMKEEIKKSSLAQFEQQTDQKLLTDVVEKLIEETSFDLPSEFLKKWMLSVPENGEIKEDEIDSVMESAEKTFRYQLIEGKLLEDNGKELTPELIREQAKENLKQQLISYGMGEGADDMIDGLLQNYLSDNEQVKRISEQIISKNLLEIIKEKSNLTVKELSYEDFVKEVYKEKN